MDYDSGVKYQSMHRFENLKDWLDYDVRTHAPPRTKREPRHKIAKQLDRRKSRKSKAASQVS